MNVQDELLEQYVMDDERFIEDKVFIDRNTRFNEYDLLKKIFFPKQWNVTKEQLAEKYSELSTIISNGLKYDNKESMRLTHVAANSGLVTIFLCLDCVVWNTN